MNGTQEAPMLSKALLATVIAGLVITAPAAAAPLDGLRAWGSATARSFDGGRTGASAVERRVRSLRRVVRREAPRLLRAAETARWNAVAAARGDLDRSLRRAPAQLRGDARYLFFLAYQAELERLAERAGLAVAPTGRPLAAAAADADGDGAVGEADGDRDGDGLGDGRDTTDLGFGIPDRFLVRRDRGPRAGQTRQGYCVYATERVPRPATVPAARAWKARAARRGCSAPRARATTSSGARASAQRRTRYVALRKLGFRASRARLDGHELTVRVRTPRRVKATFEVLSGRRAVAKSAAKTIRKGSRTVRARFRTAVAPASPKLRITITAGKRRARGTIALTIVRRPPSPQPPSPPQPSPPLPAPHCNGDTDGDTVPDCDELAGFDWRYFVPSLSCRNIGGAADPVIQCGDEHRKRVTSNPNSANTDNDGVVVGGQRFELTDAEEWQLSLQGGMSDPSHADGDTDGVSDVEELERWGSDAAHPDSDSDSVERNGNGLPIRLWSTLYDRGEIDGGTPPGSRVVTSPTVADTDGDGATDTDEVIGGSSTNPRVADVPEFSVYPAPGTTFSISIGQGTTADVELNNTQTQEEAREESDERAESTTNGQRTQIGASLEYEYPAGVKASISTEHEWSSSKTKSHTAKFTNEERTQAQRSYAERLSTNTDATGSIAATFRLGNERGELPLTVRNLSVQASFVCLAAAANADCGEVGKQAPLGTLRPTNAEDATITLAANESRDIEMVASGVPAERLRAIAANPSNLSFSPGTADLHESSTGPNLQDTIGKSIPQSTGGITIDDGSGNVVDLSIATAVDHEWGKPDPSLATRMKLADALTVAGVTLETAPTSDGHERIARIAVPGQDIDAETLPADSVSGRVEGAWAVFAHFDRFGNPIDDPSNVDELELTIYDQFVLAYVADVDADGLWNREERQIGTSDTATDSDGDQARGPCTLGAACPRGTGADRFFNSDYFEAVVGWSAGPVTRLGGVVVPAFRVHADPATCDGDGDGSYDGPGTCHDQINTGSTGTNNEQARRTDPIDPDTDGDDEQHPDDLDDFGDAQPLVANRYTPPPPPDNTQAFVASSELVCPAGTFNATDDACVIGAGQVVTTPSITLCGPPGNAGTGNCPGTTGYYRARWDVLRSGVNCDECPMGTFEVRNGSRVLLRATWDEAEWERRSAPVARRDLLFAATGPLDDLTLRYENRNGTAKVARVQISKLTLAEFVNQSANNHLTAIAIPATLLVAGATGDEADLPIPDTGSAQVAGGPDLALPGRWRGWMARFGLRMSGSSTAQALQIGVTTGASAPATEAITTAPQSDGVTYFAASGDRYPIVQGTVRPADVQAAAPGTQTYVKMLFEAHDAGYPHISLPVRSFAGAPPTALTNVVLEPIGSNVVDAYAGLVDLSGNQKDAPDTRWLAASWLPGAFTIFDWGNSVTRANGEALLTGTPSADQAEVSMYDNANLGNPLNEAVPVHSSYHKWAVVARRESMSTCSGSNTNYHLTDRYDSGSDGNSRAFASIRLDSFGPTAANPTDRTLHFAPAPSDDRNRSSLRIESLKCGSNAVPAIRVYTAMLMTRPTGQFTVSETFP